MSSVMFSSSLHFPELFNVTQCLSFHMCHCYPKRPWPSRSMGPSIELGDWMWSH